MSGQKTPVVPWHGIRETSVILLTGTQSFLADRALRIIGDRMKSGAEGVEVNDLDAADYQQGDLLQLASPSLFGEPRLVRVTAVEKCNDAFLEDALSYLEAPQPDVVVVLQHAGGNRGKKLLDALKSAGSHALVVECKDITKDAERITFVQQEFQRHDVSIEPKAVRALVDAFSSDLAELASACAQLISDAGSSGITTATVDRYYGGRVETTTFQIADQAISGHFSEALALLRHAMNSGVEPVMIVAAFAMKLRTMALVGGASGSVDARAAELGIAPWQARNARSSLHGWDQAGLGAAILEVAHTDAAVKGSGPQPDYALERMVRVVALRGKRSDQRAS
jgi:DNA polymerase-3 subunit delta